MAKKVKSVQDEPLLSTRAAAEMIGLHIRTLYRYLARGIVREPAQALQGRQGSMYSGGLRRWNAGEIELARIAIEAYRGQARGISQKKARQMDPVNCSSALANLLTTKELLNLLSVTQQTLNFICSARAEEKWGTGARLRVAARNKYGSRLFDAQDVREWFQYMMERKKKYGDLAPLQKLDGMPLFASSYQRFNLASLLRELFDPRKRHGTGPRA